MDNSDHSPNNSNNLDTLLNDIYQEVLSKTAIDYFAVYQHITSNYTTINGIQIPKVGSLLYREELFRKAIARYQNYRLAKDKIELFTMSSVVADYYEITDTDAIEKTESLLQFEIAGPKDLKFFDLYNADILAIVKRGNEMGSMDMVFPYYFVKNRTGDSLDLNELTSKQLSALLDLIASEINDKPLEQIDSTPIEIKKS